MEPDSHLRRFYTSSALGWAKYIISKQQFFIDFNFQMKISQRFSIFLKTLLQYFTEPLRPPHTSYPHLFSVMWMLRGHDVNGALRDGFSSSCRVPWWDYTFMGAFFFKWSLVMTTLCMSFHTFLLSKQYWRTPGFNFPGSSRAKCQGPQVTQTASRMSGSSTWGISVLTLWRQALIPLGHDGMWWLKYLKSWFYFIFLSSDSSF